MAIPPTSMTTRPAQTSAKSSHVEDAALQPFLQEQFDAADYLNTTLPSLSFSNTSQNAQSTRVSLPDLTTRTQTLVSQLNAQLSRLTTALDQLTDEILRSGSRLAYEVEILRGETTGLSDALREGLKEEMSLFVSPDLAGKASSPGTPSQSLITEREPALAPPGQSLTEPEYIQKLRTLTAVRARLETVIRVFGEAMQWPLAPSELASTASSFISVSAPTGTPEELSLIHI